jgi:hypothetical protein
MPVEAGGLVEVVHIACGGFSRFVQGGEMVPMFIPGGSSLPMGLKGDRFIFSFSSVHPAMKWGQRPFISPRLESDRDRPRPGAGQAICLIILK